MKKLNIVILGAGYGGLLTTIQLRRKLRRHNVNITLVNKYDYHYPSTWLHEAAAGTIQNEHTRISIKNVINTHRINFLVDSVIKIKPEENKVKLANGEIDYDILVIGLGFEGATYGVDGLSEHAFMIGNIDNSRLIREHLQYNFALYNNEKEKDQAKLNIVVGGGGFTGIELLGELANRIPDLCEEYDINKASVRIINLEASPKILSGLDTDLADYAMNSLESRGIELITGATLEECHEDKVIYEKDGKREVIPTKTVVWSGGVRANSIIEHSGFETTEGKIEVRNDLRSPDFDNVFAIGDCALIKNLETGSSYPSTAQIAIQQSKVVATNIKNVLNNKQLEEFKPSILGIIVSLGYNDGVGIFKHNHKLYGWKATVLKKFIDNSYLLKLGGLGLVLKKGRFNIFY